MMVQDKAASMWRWASRSIGAHNMGLAVIITAMVVGMTIQFPEFLTRGNLEVLVMGFILEAIIALGMTLVIISAGIDISVAAVLPFTAIVVALLLHAGLGVPLAIVLSVLIAAAVGAGNARMMSLFRVHPFIATLATMLVLRGVNLVVTKGATISNLPGQFSVLGQGRVGGIPVPVLLFAALAVVIGFLLKHHRYFQQVYFIGGNPKSARLSGIDVDRFLLFAYALCAALAGLAGVIAASQYGSANSGYGQNIEMRVITAVVIGGASLSGGRGSISGSVLGVLFLAIIYNAFAMTGVSTYWQDVVNGVMLLVAVFLGEYLKDRGKSGRAAPSGLMQAARAKAR